MGQTLGELWATATAESRTHPAYLVRNGGNWTSVSWAEAADRVDRIAEGLRERGIGRGDVVAIIGRTRLEWVLLDWALLSIGAVVVPIYPTSSESECTYIVVNAEAVGVIVEDPDQRAMFEEPAKRPAGLREILTFDEIDSFPQRASDSSSELGAVRDDDTATVIYTSGTTGPPKGCVLSHRNYVAVAERLAAMPDYLRSGDRTVLFLPLAHTFGRLVNFAGARIGFTIAFCPDVQDLPAALEEVRPHFLPSVPRVYEKTEAAVEAQLAEATGVKRRLVDWARSVGHRASHRRQQGAALPPGLAVQYRVADRLVFSKVRAKLGGRIRFGISGAAPLGRVTLEFFHSLGLPVLEAYGLTECLPVAVNLPDRNRIGTVGAPFPGCEVRIAEDGEILARGEPLFQGYLTDDAATRAVIDDQGWFHTGDIGDLDADGFLTITDRKKDLIATAGGKKVSPQHIEHLLKERSPLVSQALVVGDRRPFVAALITLSNDELTAWAHQGGLDGSNEQLLASDELRAVIADAVDAANHELARPAQVKRFAILPREFSAEEQEITPTLKLKRQVCAKHFAAEIEELYAGPARLRY
jgi:long-chain acyl-CoA synthetase